jgi:hypothetical protein
VTSLLADIVASRQLQAEPVATDALVHLLTRSAAGRASMAKLLNELCPTAEATELSFTGQVVSGDDGRPDIVACDAYGVRLVVEAKFDAALTPIQLTMAYARQLVPDLPGAIVFLVPQDRLEALSTELLRAIGADGAISKSEHTHVLALLDGQKVLAAISWQFLLSRVRRAMEQALEHENLADLVQIEGLVAWRTRAGWVPLLDGDLPETAGRQLSGVIHAALNAAQRASAQRISQGSGDQGAGRYIWTRG